MRKELLRAGLAATTWLLAAHSGLAQTTTYTTDPSVTVGPLAAPWIPSTITGAPAVRAGSVGSPPPTIAPGNVVVRLDGVFRFYAAALQQQDVNTAGSAGTGTSGGSKLAPYQFATVTRLFPSFQAVAANGMRYGAFIEFRTDAGGGAGGGVYGSPSGTNANRGEVYIRRSFGYLGTEKAGTLRFGGTDQPTSLFIIGTFENFDPGGGWNGDLPAMLASNVAPVWPFADVGNLYSTTKVEYLSPQLYGFDFGVSYEPNTGTPSLGSNCNTSGFRGGSYIGAGQGVAGAGCDALSSTGTADYSRRRNTIDAVLRYRGSVGPIGLGGTVGYMGSGKVRDDATPQRALQYDGLNVGDFGFAATYAGFTVGGHADYGRFNNGWSLAPDGQPSGFAWIAGASYTIGPLVFGGSYFNVTSAGDTTLAAGTSRPLNGTRMEQGAAAGATYAIAPGLSAFVSYLWGERRETGFNFLTGSSSSTGVVGSGLNALDHNKVTSQGIAIGSVLTW